MGLFLAIVGLLLTAIDFFELTHRAETFAVGLRERLTIANNRRYEFNSGIERRFPLVKWVALPELLMILAFALSLLVGGTNNPVALTIFGVALITYFLYKFGVYFFSYSVLLLHALSIPKKGIVATLGLVLAVIGVWIEFSK